MKEANLILIDTSAWINALRQGGDTLVRNKVDDVLAKDLGATTEMIMLEIMRGARTKRDYEELLEELQSLRLLSIDSGVWEQAYRLSFDLRRKGKTIPSTDILIAAVGLHYGCRILHADSHFDQISTAEKLEIEDWN